MDDRLQIDEIKAFIPSSNYELSKKFYLDLGFTIASDFDGVAYFYRGMCPFLLQDFYVKEHCENFMMHFAVEDINEWYEHIVERKIVEKYSVLMSEIKIQPWNMYEFTLTDPSGVLLRIAQNIPKK